MSAPVLNPPTAPLVPEASGAAPLTNDRLIDAWQTARTALLAERNEQGYWVGELASSPLSTATAISALVIAEQHTAALDATDSVALDRWNAAYQTDLSELIVTSVRWLAEQQNDDGGWGDTDRSKSNLATTLLVLSALRMTGTPAKDADLEPRAEAYVRSQGGVAGLKKRYGGDRTFAAPILANCALAGVVPWKKVPTLPFELAALPRSWFRLMGLPVVSYAIPALVAIGLAKHHHRPSLNPLTRVARRLATERCLRLVTKMQPDSGGFLEATPLTSFVVMALASTGRADHSVVRRGVEFLLASVRPDGSWPIDTNLATWNTTLAVNALRKGGRRKAEGGSDSEPSPATKASPSSAFRLSPSLDWLLACQHTEPHPFTAADPGGWAWTNLSGGVPDADDTAGALLALRSSWDNTEGEPRTRIARAASRGVRWLLDLQNKDGGWPTFCRGWGTLPFDRSATDLTAHVLRALHTWRQTRGWWTEDPARPNQVDLDGPVDRAIAAGRVFLSQRQTEAGCWEPLWFGNEDRPGETNPVFGTSRVLLALAEVEGLDSPMAARGLEWLVGQQHASGAWGADPRTASGDQPAKCSVEETAVATEALLPWRDRDRRVREAVEAGLAWLAEAVEQGGLSEPSPIGLYFAKLWYHERLYPKSFAVSALGSAIEACVASERESGDDNGVEQLEPAMTPA